MEIYNRNYPILLDVAYPFKKRNLNSIKTITLHHSGDGVKLNLSHEDFATRERNFHISKGWSSIGYHYSIHGDGSIWQHHSVDWVSWHDGVNYDSIGIVILGDYRASEGLNVVTDKILQSMQFLLDELCYNSPQFPAGRANLVGHKERMQTACPCDLQPFVVNYRNVGKVKDDVIITHPKSPFYQHEISQPIAMLDFNTFTPTYKKLTNQQGSSLFNANTKEVVKDFEAHSILEANYENSDFYMTKFSYDKKLPNVLRKSEWELVVEKPANEEGTAPATQAEQDKARLQAELELMKAQIVTITANSSQAQVEADNKLKEAQARIEELNNLMQVARTDFDGYKQQKELLLQSLNNEISNLKALKVDLTPYQQVLGDTLSNAVLSEVKARNWKERYQSWVDSHWQSQNMRSFLKYDLIFIILFTIGSLLSQASLVPLLQDKLALLGDYKLVGFLVTATPLVVAFVARQFKFIMTNIPDSNNNGFDVEDLKALD